MCVMQVLRTRMFRGSIPHRRRALVLCDCGQKFFCWEFHLKSGNTKSCGCRRASRNGWKSRTYSEPYSMKTHPLFKEYRRWRGMMDRCYRKTGENFHNYGGRGIVVHPRWHDFENFLADVGSPPTAQHSIDRVDNDKGYGPNNWRWATRKQQANNRRPRSPRSDWRE